MENIYQKITEFDLARLLAKRIKKTDGTFWSAFFAAFITLNLIFAFHGISFLFGDHDWRYLRDGVPLQAGLFEGRFTQFLAINLLSQGEILPLINNVLGFAGFSYGIALLAQYWKLPHQKTPYILFALFTAVTPYILSFMYFAFLIMPVLSWNAFIIGALIISEKESTFSYQKSLTAVMLITLALGGYPPVINLLATAFTARLLIGIIFEQKTIKKLWQDYRFTLINIITAGILYKLILTLLSISGQLNPNYYNLQTAPVSTWPAKLLLVIKDLFLEFTATLPFITAKYKAFLTIIAVAALLIVIKSKRKPLGILLYLTLYISGLITLFLSTSIKETEFSPRIDFFGFMYGIAGSYALILKSREQSIKNLATTAAVFCIMMSANTLFEAQKVWKLGFESELRIYKRISKRLEEAPLFNQKNRYIVVQGGGIATRERYYSEKYKYTSDDLLSVAYVPGMASGVMWNYYAPRDYTDTTSYVYTFDPKEDFKKDLREASVWPKEGSVKVGSYWILLSLSKEGLEYLRAGYGR